MSDEQSTQVEFPSGHEPVIPFRAGERPPSPDPNVVERFRKVFIPDISDAVGMLFTMNGTIRPLYEGMDRVLGPAVTVKAVPGDNWAIHAALSRCEPGDVLVVDWRGYTGACGTGALTTALAIKRGLAGVVIDGAWRDINDLRRLRFPIMGVGISPFSPGARRLGEINVPVNCGGVIVEPGDLVVGDYEGAVVVPREHMERVADSLPPYEELNSVDQSLPLKTGADGMTRTASLYWSRAARHGTH